MADYGGLVRRAAEAAKGFKAYHASPHDFEKFDIGKIGTGQGAASYGKGIYVAENPAVSGLGGEYWQEFARRFNQGNTPEAHATRILETTGGDRTAAAAKVQAALSSGIKTQYPRELLEDSLKLLQSDAKIGPRVYELQINRDPSEFLDWDKPLAQMSPKIQQKLADAWLAHPEAHAHQTGGQIYGNIAIDKWKLQPSPGPRPEQGLASDALRDLGIPGIRYLDQGSRQAVDVEQQLARAKGQGIASMLKEIKETRPPLTSNAVLFGTDYIDILRKYGIVGAPLGAGMMQGQGQQQ